MHVCVCYCVLCMCVAMIDRWQLQVVFIALCSTRLSAPWAPAQQETKSVTDPYHPQTLRWDHKHTHSVGNPIQSRCISPLPEENTLLSHTWVESVNLQSTRVIQTVKVSRGGGGGHWIHAHTELTVFSQTWNLISIAVFGLFISNEKRVWAHYHANAVNQWYGNYEEVYKQDNKTPYSPTQALVPSLLLTDSI